MLSLLESIICSILVLMSRTYLFPLNLLRRSASPQLQPPSPPLLAPGFTATTSLSGCGVKPSRQREVLPSLNPARTYFLDSKDKFSRHSEPPRTTLSKQEWHWLALQPLLSFSHNIYFCPSPWHQSGALLPCILHPFLSYQQSSPTSAFALLQNSSISPQLWQEMMPSEYHN